MMRGMGGPAGGWHNYLRNNEEAEPNVTRELLRRVARYARPYVGKISLTLLAEPWQGCSYQIPFWARSSCKAS